MPVAPQTSDNPSAPRIVSTRSAQLAAVAEVLGAFTLVHVSYRALKYFTVVGRWEAGANTNFIPGTAMALFTASLLLLCRRSFEEYGFNFRQWRTHLKIALSLVLLAVTLAGLGLLLTGVHFDPAHPHNNVVTRLAGAGLGVIALGAAIRLARSKNGFIGRVPSWAAVVLWFILASFPILLSSHAHRSLPATVLNVSWLLLAAGFGEEIFFRGYIQSRLDRACGKPFRLLGLKFGIGLLLSSLLFGFLHALNSVDYFHGRFNFAWWFGLQNFCFGLFYGALREKMDSILPGAITHGLLDVMATVPGLLGR